jgi:signal transduction histidine kinase
VLSFHTFGKAIEDTQKVFRKYYRENETVGGYGLGLSIIWEICQKYDVGITLDSDEERGTTFAYRFKCHTGDTSNRYD